MNWIDVKPYLHVRSASNPVYHPNGEVLSFITNYTGLPQVWELRSEKGWPSQISFTEERIIFVKYIPGTNNRVIGMDVGVNEKEQIFFTKGTR